MNLKQRIGRSNKIADSQTKETTQQIANEIFGDDADKIYFFGNELKVITREEGVTLGNLKTWMDLLDSYDVDVYDRNDRKRGLVLKFYFKYEVA